MYKKKSFICIIIIIILLLSIFPSITSQSFKTKFEENTLSRSTNIQDKNINDITLNIIIYKNDGEVEKNFKKISRTELENMKSDITIVMKSDLEYIEKFEYVLEKLKENNLILNNLELKDIINLTKFENKNLKFDNVTNKNFIAHFAPMIVVGGGFGIGLGDPENRVINGFAHFLAVIGGLAYVLCLDFFENIAYQLISFMFPIFVGYIAGYTGIIIFAVVPGIFYSNLLMIGLAPFTCWLSFPEAEDE